MFFEQMHPGWQQLLAQSAQSLADIESLLPDQFLPARQQVMRAFTSDPKGIRAVILGQDPYPTPDDAIGLAFAVAPGRNLPRSLRNIVTELEDDLGKPVSAEIDLANWQDRGVMLLNTSLTTLANQAAAHSNIGWQDFTLSALQRLAEQQPFIVLAWGNHAKVVARNIGGSVKVIESAHPSPLSAHSGFFGSKPFSRANAALLELGLEPIDWSL